MILLKVDGMTCGHCVSAVRKAVLSVDPGASVEVDLAAGTARVTGQASAGRLAGAIGAEGYAVGVQATNSEGVQE